MNIDKGKKVFEMLGFQYKPLQKRFLNDFSKDSGVLLLYANSNYIKKIRILDLYAQKVLGL